MCRDMVRQGFEGYIREHTIETGWTKEFVAANPELIEKFLQVRMSGIAPLENYLHFILARQEHDHTNRLKEIRVPTLVLHRTGDRCLRVEEGRYVASLIPNARFVELPGDDHLPFVGDQDALLKEIRVPTLVLVGDDERHGAADRTHWDAAQQLAREIPNAKLVVLQGEGHHYLATNPNAAHVAIREFIG